GAESNGDAKHLDVIGIHLKRRRASSVGEGIEKGGQTSGGHCSTSNPALAAMRRARCWRTLALLTLTPIACAASLMEHASRKRSSSMRRERSGKVERTLRA